MNPVTPASPRAGFGVASPTELPLLSKPTALPLSYHGELYKSRRYSTDLAAIVASLRTVPAQQGEAALPA